MTAALPGKHQFGSIGDTRVTFIEKGILKERLDFLQKLLEHNGFEVVIGEDKRKSEDDPQTYTLGVTDMVFNPTIWIFERRLLTPDGRKVTHDYWDQKTDETKPQYYESEL